MLLKYPEVLYFLILLLIPILVHLFQLRRFKKVYFTNVKLLKQLKEQTRKSKSIKKWLLLATRLLLLTTLIFAFAQPYCKAKDEKNKATNLVILLDTSFSMQNKSKHGELLKKSLQDILENIPENTTFSLLTPDYSFWNTTKKTIQNKLQNIDYSPSNFSVKSLLLKAETKNFTTKNSDFILISDGININEKEITPLINKSVFIVQPKIENTTNYSIEKVTFTPTTSNFYKATITVKKTGNATTTIPLTLYNNDTIIAKSLLHFKNSATHTTTLNLPKKEYNKGKITITDNSLTYDNTYYFSIDTPKKQNVLLVGTPEKNKFITKILNETKFSVTQTTEKQLDFNTITKQQVIFLNEIENLSQAMSSTIANFYKNGGTVVFIPSEKNSLQNNNFFLKDIANINYTKNTVKNDLITEINFNHHLLTDVFEKKIKNFQYPKINNHFTINGTALETVLNYSSGNSFLSSVTNAKQGNLYIFSGAINAHNSNFKNTPLVVPIIYNIASTSIQPLFATFSILDNVTFSNYTTLGKDEVLRVTSNTTDFIPQQQILNDKVLLSFSNQPKYAGNYTIKNNDKITGHISFNYSRYESITKQSFSIFNRFTTIQSVSEAIHQLQENRTETPLWKWFITISICFLIIEIIIQKTIQ